VIVTDAPPLLVYLECVVHLPLCRRASGRQPHATRRATQAGQAAPKALPRTAVEALLETVAHDQGSQRQTDWAERDLAIILTALLAGLRAEELRHADAGDIRTTDDGSAVIHVKGKGGKDRGVPIEAELLSVIEVYLTSRNSPLPRRYKAQSGRRELCSIADGPHGPPFLSAADGERITRGLCNRESSELSSARAPCTACAIPTLRNSPAQTSACTP